MDLIFNFHIVVYKIILEWLDGGSGLMGVCLVKELWYIYWGKMSLQNVRPHYSKKWSMWSLSPTCMWAVKSYVGLKSRRPFPLGQMHSLRVTAANQWLLFRQNQYSRRLSKCYGSLLLCVHDISRRAPLSNKSFARAIFILAVRDQ